MTDEVRLPTASEIAILNGLLTEGFPGRDALQKQLEGLKVQSIDAQGSLRLVPVPNAPAADVRYRVPVEAEILDKDGIPIHIGLHVIDGLIDELEIYRADSAPIQRTLSLREARLIVF